MAGGKLSATTGRKDSVAAAECGRAQQIENLCEHHVVSVKQRGPSGREPDNSLTLGKHRLCFQVIQRAGVCYQVLIILHLWTQVGLQILHLVGLLSIVTDVLSLVFSVFKSQKVLGIIGYFMCQNKSG